ncbi:hypothetical protein B0H14DRAFT_299590 [Mycena olivaceomarginata]|nr:hypothetical protein B0H14DRAFT_2985522 [Mycena olivaceomarginata]KAJ7868959.1 hypothetical protein B0H14DRAFT_299590 [Mycena olivaceomarginata]
MGDRILPLHATQNASVRSAMLEHHNTDFLRIDPEDLIRTRKEVARRERVAAEQRRRNELRNSYENLRKVLPPSKQKNSKISLVHRATSHISSIDEENKLLQDRIVMLELEIQQLTNLLKGSVGGGAKASH